MQADSDEIYKTREGCEITPTQVEQRVLKNKTTWKIALDERWETILAAIESSSVKILQIKSPDHFKIFKIIDSIDFIQLIQLNLSEINLPTAEPLIALKMPRLEYLWLCHNNLTNLRSLRKMNFPWLKQLHLYDNKIMDCSPLFQISAFLQLMIVVSKKIKKPMEYRHVQFYRNPLLQNYIPFFKLSNNIKLSVPFGPEYINNNILVPKFTQKYSKTIGFDN